MIQKVLDKYGSMIAELDRRATEIQRLRKWVFATARSLEQSGLTVEEYNEITAEVIAGFVPAAKLTGG